MSSAGVANARSGVRSNGLPAEAADGAVGVERSLALGWIAVLPLVLVYEIAASRHPSAAHNAAEYLISLPFRALLSRPEWGRYGLELAATALAVWWIFHDELALARRSARIALEGFVAAIALGPVLLIGLHVLDIAPPAIPRPTGVPTLGSAAILVGGAAFEEVVFRVAVIAALAFAARRTFEWFLGLPRTARVAAECVALLGSALLFAAAHLTAVVSLLAPGGEAFDSARFAWRATAGLVLALLYRWRGMGVAAWCHAFFNLALLLGAGPEIFL